MKLEQSFEVAAPLERVWEALVDVERVAPCLPGAAVTGRNEDGSYNGTFKVKIGPTSASYTGKLNMEQIDESVHTATMQAQGTDKRGQGGAKATIVSSLAAAGDGATRVDVSTDYHITGRLARFGRGGMIEDISNRLLGEFAKCLQTSLAGVPEGDEAAQAPTAGSGAGNASEAADTAVMAASTATDSPASPPPGLAGEDEAAGAGAADAAPEPGAADPAPEPGAADPAPEPGAADPAPEPGAAAASAGASSGENGGTSAPAQSSRPSFTPAPESEPVQGLSLVGGALLRQARQNPAPVVALLLGFLLAIRVRRRRD